jgi:hypothetical protein
MENVSGFGLRIQIVADTTFPAGFTLSQFADDVDPFDSPSVQVADKAMGLNGDLVVWSKASPLPVSIAVVPDSEDDLNLQALLDANRVGRGKLGAADVITATVIYPDGSTKTFGPGAITDGPAAVGVASAGRKKTSTYQFAFENTAQA